MDILNLLLGLVVVFYLHLSESELTNGNLSAFFVLSAKMASTWDCSKKKALKTNQGMLPTIYSVESTDMLSIQEGNRKKNKQVLECKNNVPSSSFF